MAQVVSQASSTPPFSSGPFGAIEGAAAVTTPHSFSFPRSDDSNTVRANQSTDGPFQVSSIEPGHKHRRAHSSLNSSTPLPEFKFGSASSSSAPSAANPPLPTTPSQYAQTPSTASSRHRRFVTESDVPAAPSSTDSDNAASALPIASAVSVSVPRHRHRRSGAVSSQDLSSIMSQGPPQSPKLPGDGQAPWRPTPSSDFTNVQKAPPLRTVETLDTIESLPRPASMVSSESGSSSSTIREPMSPNSNPMPVTHPPSRQDAITSSLPDSAMSEPEIPSNLCHDLNENFDEDPTMIVTIPGTEMAPLPPFSGWHPVPRPKSSGYLSEKEPPHWPSEMIDLDCAVADSDLGSSHAPIRSSFQKARSSMHSGSSSGFLGATVPRHRRSESAPSLPPLSFSFPELESSASGRGFPIVNVVEEEGEEREGDKAHVSSELERNHDSESSQNEPAVARLVPSLLPAIQFNFSRPSNDERFESDEEGCDEILAVPRPPFASSDAQSNSSKSSPQLLQSGSSSCDPSPRCYQSADDVPSLISTSSTVESSVNPAVRNSSVPSMTPMVVGSTTSLSASGTRQQKRLSIVSLSRLISRSKKSNTSADSSPARQLYTSDGLHPPQDTSAARRLSKMRRFLNPFKRTTTT